MQQAKQLLKHKLLYKKLNNSRHHKTKTSDSKDYNNMYWKHLLYKIQYPSQEREKYTVHCIRHRNKLMK